jgi:hypothetical protein
MKIEDMDLQAVAKAAAFELLHKHPEIEFTSGRRTIHEQAHAMASNIVTSGHRKWIEQTYAASNARDKLQKWIDQHPDSKTIDALASGLEEVLKAMSSDELSRVSMHLSGLAFDVKPVSNNEDIIKNDIRSLKGLTKFLDKEGGLVRWHAQF